MSSGRELAGAEDAGRVLREARTVAVLGFPPDESRPAHDLPA